MSQPAAATRRHCLNCDTAIDPAAERFCAHCGQRTDTARLRLGDIVRDLMHAFVNVERGPLVFARALLLRPGTVARDYVDGRRRRHYGPFATLAVLVGLTALAINLSGFQVLAQDGLASGPTALLQRHFNLLLLAQLPLQGAVCMLLFRAERLLLPEHMVLVAYTMSVRAVLIALSGAAAYAAGLRTPGIVAVAVFWAVWYVYFGWAASHFYRCGGWRRLRGSAAAALEHGLAYLLLLGASAAFEAAVARAV